jgi:hypothetical protein
MALKLHTFQEETLHGIQIAHIPGGTIAWYSKCTHSKRKHCMALKLHTFQEETLIVTRNGNVGGASQPLRALHTHIRRDERPHGCHPSLVANGRRQERPRVLLVPLKCNITPLKMHHNSLKMHHNSTSNVP